MRDDAGSYDSPAGGVCDDTWDDDGSRFFDSACDDNGSSDLPQCWFFEIPDTPIASFIKIVPCLLLTNKPCLIQNVETVGQIQDTVVNRKYICELLLTFQ